MKTTIYIFAFACLLWSCGNTNVKPEADAKPQGELWAEQVESNTDVKKPESWSDADWNATVKGVNKEKIVSTILDAVMAGKLKAYNYFMDSVAFSVEQVREMLHRTDTMFTQDINTGKMMATTQTFSFSPEDLAQVRMREKWFFDKENFRLEKKVTTLVFLKNTFADDGTVKGVTPLFLVKLNE